MEGQGGDGELSPAAAADNGDENSNSLALEGYIIYCCLSLMLGSVS